MNEICVVWMEPAHLSRSMADAMIDSLDSVRLFVHPSFSHTFYPFIIFCTAREQHDAMMASHRVASVLGCLLLLLSVAVGRAASSLESAVVSPSEASSCSLHPQACHVSPDLSSSEAYILNFLKTHDASTKTFHIQGWRWHTLSLARDTRRLWNLASRLMQDSTFHTEGNALVDKAVYHVIDFNMKALHQIETEIFFPWLQEQLTSVDDPSLAESFQVVLDDVIEKQKMVSKLGSDVVRFCHDALDFCLSWRINCSN
jgi:hypothetical protein